MENPTLHDGVVVTITSTTHAAGHVMCVDDPLVALARIRAALVGVMQQPRWGLAAFQSHLEGLDDQMAIVDGTDGPADHQARVEIEQRRQVELAAAGRSRTPSCRRPQRWFGASAPKSWPSTFVATG